MMMMMMPSCRERGGKKHTTMDALLSLFDVSLSLSLSLFLAPQILLDKERKKERKKEDRLFLLLGLLLLLLLVPSKALLSDDDVKERRFLTDDGV